MALRKQKKRCERTAQPLMHLDISWWFFISFFSSHFSAQLLTVLCRLVKVATTQHTPAATTMRIRIGYEKMGMEEKSLSSNKRARNDRFFADAFVFFRLTCISPQCCCILNTRFFFFPFILNLFPTLNLHIPSQTHGDDDGNRKCVCEERNEAKAFLMFGYVSN